MSRAGDVFENPVTGERGVARVGTEESGGDLLVAELSVRLGGAVAGEHLHPVIAEHFTVLRGRVGFRIDDRESVAPVEERFRVAPGVAHDWWNAGEEEAHVVVEINPAARFEEAIRNSFGLVRDGGKTDAQGMPGLLQLALFAREFEDVLLFTKPPRVVQRLLFGILAPVARLAGYRGSYPEYVNRPPEKRVEVEPWRLSV